MFKSLCFAVLATMLGVANLCGQSNNSPLRLGIRAGGLACWVTNADDASTDSTTFERGVLPSYSFGFGVGKNLRRNFGFEMGLMYTRLGSTNTLGYRIGGQDTSIDVRTEVTYFQVPLMAEVFSSPEKKLQVLGQFGIVLGLINHVRVFVDNERATDFVLGDYLRQRDLWATAELSAAGGAGIRYALGERLELQAILRGSYSLLDVEDQRYKVQDRAASRHLTVGLMLGFSYRFTNRPAGPQPAESREESGTPAAN